MYERLNPPDNARGWAWHHRSGRGHRASHQHDELEANLVVEGRAAYVIDGRRVALAPDDLLFLHPDEDHILVDESADFRMWLAVWRPELVAAHVRAGLDPVAGTSHPEGVQLRRLAPDPARRLARLMADVAAQEGVAREAGATYLLWRCRAAFTTAADPGTSLAHPACARAARLLREDPGLPVATVAAHVALSPDHLERAFRREAGMGLAAYRARLRLARALELWDAGQRDLLRLALDCGFGSYSAFQRAFRVRYGRGPRDYLRVAAVDDRVIGAPSPGDGAGAERRWADTMGGAHPPMPPTALPEEASRDKARGVGRKAVGAKPLRSR